MPKKSDQFAPLANAVEAQKDHELGIRAVFDDLQREGYEIQAVNTDQNKVPQIVATRKGFTVLIAVRTQRGPLPELPQPIRQQLFDHATHLDAACFFAPVALWSTGERNENGDEGFFVKYHGMQPL